MIHEVAPESGETKMLFGFKSKDRQVLSVMTVNETYLGGGEWAD